MNLIVFKTGDLVVVRRSLLQTGIGIIVNIIRPNEDNDIYYRVLVSGLLKKINEYNIASFDLARSDYETSTFEIFQTGYHDF